MRLVACSAAAFAIATLATVPSAAMDKAACAAAAVSGQRFEQKEKLKEAHQQFAVCATAACPDVISRDCTRWMKGVAQRIPTLDLSVHAERGPAPSGAVVDLGGRVIPLPAKGVLVDPGRYAMTFRAPGFVTKEQRFDVAPGARLVTDVALAPVGAAALEPVAAEPKPASRTPWLVSSIATTTIAVAGFAIFTGFGVAGLSDQEGFRTSCAPYCSQAQVDQVAGEFTVANVALVTGLVALAATAVSWFFTVRSHR
jgi:hypothetical protein